MSHTGKLGAQFIYSQVMKGIILTPPAAQLPILYGNPARNSGSPRKIAARTISTAEWVSGIVVFVIPSMGTPPPQRVASRTSPP
jgi:hypothetical protein